MNQSRDFIPMVKVRMPPADRLMPQLQDVLYSGMVSEGDHVYRFERQFSEHFHLPEVLGFSSGTGALHAALILAGVEAGDEVITTSMTAEPTNISILMAGGVPVFADVDPETGNLDPHSVLRQINPRTKAICVVHYAGYPANLSALRTIADLHGLKLIEDCAHALGARYDGIPIGAVGDFSIFSLQAIKHMTTIDGGILVVKDSALIERAKKLRWFGMTKGMSRTLVNIEEVGFKYNMTNVAAAIGSCQLESIDEAIGRHVDNGRYFDEKLAAIFGLQPGRIEAGSDPTYWIYTLLCDDANDVERRLTSVGVAASKLHRPNHYHDLFANYRRETAGLDAFYRRLIHIPCGWWVSEADRDRIVTALSRG